MTDQLPPRTYPAAGGVVVKPDQEQVLVLLRPGRLGPGSQPEVRLPKGHIEEGESHRQAALREVQEETGLSKLEILADLGQQTVEFDWQGHHYIRQEFYFLMGVEPTDVQGIPERQFEPQWLPWARARASLTFEAEREWMLRAQRTWLDLKQSNDNAYDIT